MRASAKGIREVYCVVMRERAFTCNSIFKSGSVSFWVLFSGVTSAESKFRT